MKKWLLNHFLPMWAKETVLWENRQLRKENRALQVKNDQLQDWCRLTWQQTMTRPEARLFIVFVSHPLKR